MAYRAKPVTANAHPELSLQDNGEWVFIKIRTNRERDTELMELCAQMLIHRWSQELTRTKGE